MRTISFRAPEEAKFCPRGMGMVTVCVRCFISEAHQWVNHEINLTLNILTKQLLSQHLEQIAVMFIATENFVV